MLQSVKKTVWRTILLIVHSEDQPIHVEVNFGVQWERT